MTPRAYTLRHYPVVGTAESLSCNGSFSSDNQLPLTYITGNPDSIIETKSDGNSTWISVAPKRLHREWISIPRHHRVSLSNHPGNRFPDQLEKAGMAEHASLQETKYLSVDSQVCPGNCYLDPEACKDKVHEALREEVRFAADSNYHNLLSTLARRSLSDTPPSSFSAGGGTPSSSSAGNLRARL